MANSTKRVSRPAVPGVSKLTKACLREAVRARLAALSGANYTAAGAAAARCLPALPGWERFRSVLAFCSLHDEIDTGPLLESILDAKKALFLPRVEGDFLAFYRVSRRDLAVLYGQSGAFGIREPEPKRPLGAADFPALIVCPGLAFDRSGHRLGRGRGFYDRFFAALDECVFDERAGAYAALGFCMDCQLVDCVPVDGRDRAVHGVITEKRLCIVSGKAGGLPAPGATRPRGG